VRILQVIPYLNPKRGGDVNVCCHLSTRLREIGHDVTIATTDFGYDRDFGTKIEQHGIEVVRFKCVFNIGLFIFTPSMKKWLDRNIGSYDIVHVHGFRSYQSSLVRRYSSIKGIPYIIQAHGAVLTLSAKSFRKLIYDVVWGHRVLRQASRAVALTKTEVRNYVEKGVPVEKIEVIPNGIDVEHFSHSRKGSFRKEYKIDKCDKILLYLGRLHATKGIELLLSSYANLVELFPRSRLVIAGPDDGYERTLRKQAVSLHVSERILFSGFVSDRMKMDALADADVFVTPRFSGFPVTFLESCACGVPIVTTTRGDEIDWIHNNVGFVVEYGVSELQNAIERLLMNDSLRKDFGENGRRIVRERFTWNVISEKFENLYQNVVKTK